MNKNKNMIISKNTSYSTDCYATKLNNNVLVVGATGAGKTRGIVIPNILSANESLVISDPKGNLRNQYGGYLAQKGYIVKKLDFTNPDESDHYNFFRYIRNNQDINKIATMLIKSAASYKHIDPFWDDAGTLLMTALIAYLWENFDEPEQKLAKLQKLLELCNVQGDLVEREMPLDMLFEDVRENSVYSYATDQYDKFRVAADRTLRSILITVNAKLGMYDTPAINDMTSIDDIKISEIGNRKTAVFVIVSDTDRSMDGLANLFFTQCMSELCYVADHTPDYRLKIPVRFILDDFATNVKIHEFPRMISSIRSRGISTMLMIQSESQLRQGYQDDALTIIGNCDTYVYMGCNDIETQKSISMRCDTPLKRISAMPVGKCWIFRRGFAPLYDDIIDLDEYIKDNKLEKQLHVNKTAIIDREM